MTDRRLALLDWDNTLRRGFTVIDWTSFLKSRNQYDEVIDKQISAAIGSYRRRQLTYAVLSELIGGLYSSGLAGQSISSIQKSAVDFVAEDQKNLFQFTPSFLALLADENIDACIVSGCPSEVLDAYSSVLTWHSYYGLETEHRNGYYTGRVAANRADVAGKELVVSKIMGDGRVQLAAGDSASDLPLLERAQVKLIFDNPNLFKAEPSVYHLDPSRPASEIVDAVRHALRHKI